MKTIASTTKNAAMVVDTRSNLYKSNLEGAPFQNCLTATTPALRIAVTPVISRGTKQAGCPGKRVVQPDGRRLLRFNSVLVWKQQIWLRRLAVDLNGNRVISIVRKMWNSDVDLKLTRRN